MKRFSWTFMLLLFAFSTSGFSKEWNRIVPCVSSRRDAEKILGKDIVPHSGPFGSYWYKKSRVYIDYFRKGNNSSDKDVVQHILIFPKNSILLSKFTKKTLNFPTGFVKTVLEPKITHIGYLAYYFNATEGYEIVVQKDDDDKEVITGFEYYGLASDCEKLNSPIQDPGASQGMTYTPNWFAAINDPKKPDWEILPQERQAGEFVWSKLNDAAR